MLCELATVTAVEIAILTAVSLASTNNALPDDGVTNSETCRSCFNVNFKVVFKTTHWCIDW